MEIKSIALNNRTRKVSMHKIIYYKEMPLLLILIIAFTSCKSHLALRTSHGDYYKHGKDYVYELKLRDDSTFLLKQRYMDASPTCEGKWSLLSADTIFLKCFEEKDTFAQLNAGYMQRRENKIVILSPKKIKLGQVVLKKIH